MAGKRPVWPKIPSMETNSQKPLSYRADREGYAFVLERAEVERLKAMPEFEGQEEPAVADDFLRFRAESWADVLSSAGAAPGEIRVSIDPHQKKAHLKQAQKIVITADI
jgi:hypothetical protein